MVAIFLMDLLLFCLNHRPKQHTITNIILSSRSELAIIAPVAPLYASLSMRSCAHRRARTDREPLVVPTATAACEALSLTPITSFMAQLARAGLPFSKSIAPVAPSYASLSMPSPTHRRARTDREPLVSLTANAACEALSSIPSPPLMAELAQASSPFFSIATSEPCVLAACLLMQSAARRLLARYMHAQLVAQKASAEMDAFLADAALRVMSEPKPVGVASVEMPAAKPLGELNMATAAKPLGELTALIAKPLGVLFEEVPKPVGVALMAAKPVGELTMATAKPVGVPFAVTAKPLGALITAVPKPLGVALASNHQYQIWPQHGTHTYMCTYACSTLSPKKAAQEQRVVMRQLAPHEISTYFFSCCGLASQSLSLLSALETPGESGELLAETVETAAQLDRSQLSFYEQHKQEQAAVIECSLAQLSSEPQLSFSQHTHHQLDEPGLNRQKPIGPQPFSSQCCSAQTGLEQQMCAPSSPTTLATQPFSPEAVLATSGLQPGSALLFALPALPQAQTSACRTPPADMCIDYSPALSYSAIIHDMFMYIQPAVMHTSGSCCSSIHLSQPSSCYALASNMSIGSDLAVCCNINDGICMLNWQHLCK
jgi:hypothetical protein